MNGSDDWCEGECPKCHQHKKVRDFPRFGVLCSECYFAQGPQGHRTTHPPSAEDRITRHTRGPGHRVVL